MKFVIDSPHSSLYFLTCLPDLNWMLNKLATYYYFKIVQLYSFILQNYLMLTYQYNFFNNIVFLVGRHKIAPSICFLIDIIFFKIYECMFSLPSRMWNVITSFPFFQVHVISARKSFVKPLILTIRNFLLPFYFCLVNIHFVLYQGCP